MATPFPFVSGQVLTASQMNSMNEAVSFTPSFSTLTIGNGTRTGTYFIQNKVLYFEVTVTFGSTTTMGTSPDLTLPFAVVGFTQFNPILNTTMFFDNSATGFVYGNLVLITSTTIRLVNQTASGTYVSLQDVAALLPFTWAVNDRVIIRGQYQIA